MTSLTLHLFGQFAVQYNQHPLDGLESRKAQELLCYLLLQRQHAHIREKLAGMLWGDTSTAQSKTYLRKALWQLQTALHPLRDSLADDVLLVTADEVQINPHADIWLDVGVLEQTFEQVRGVPGEQIDAPCARAVRDAILLYRGDLLEGWYQDWCLYERERLQNMYLALVDKLMAYCEMHGSYEEGVEYGERMLRYERARERTYQRMMRLYYLAGDRTAALRQYERCVTALLEELAVEPTAYTQQLYQQMRANQFDHLSMMTLQVRAVGGGTTLSLHEMLVYLQQFQATLTTLHHQIEQGIQAVERVLNQRH